MKVVNSRDRYLGLRSKLDTLLLEKSRVKEDRLVLNTRLETLTSYEVLIGQSSTLLKEIAEVCEVNSKQLIEKIVGRGLRVIFDETEKFEVKIKSRMKSIYAYMCLGESDNIIDSRGGGYVDVISVLTVLVLILQQNPSMQRFLVLDESFAEVGREHLDKVGQFLHFLVDKLGMNILLVTHSEELVEYSDIVYNVSMDNGQTRVKRVV